MMKPVENEVRSINQLLKLLVSINQKPFTVFVEGNIGSGKTTYLEHFRQFEDITLLTEPVEEWRNLKGWNLLDLMYKDPEKWAMTFQSYVSLTMLEAHRRPTPTPVKLMERSLYSARYCFVEHMKRSGTMHPAQFAVLEEWFRFIHQQIPIEADLIAVRHFYKMSSGNQKPFTVFVEGNIGSGKTTYLEHFRQFEDITLLTEPVEEWRNLKGWNLLDLMYKDPEKWAMTFQSYVSLTMLEAHRRPTPTPVKLMERSLYSARYCFVEHMKRSGTMHPAQFAVLEEWFRFIHQQIPIEADLIVYLKTTPAIVHERIKKRARSEEQCVPLSYIEDLHQLHEDWLVRKTHAECPAPVLVLDADLDLSQITEEYKKSEHQILKKAVDFVMNSPNKHSPKRPITTSPIKINSPCKILKL